MTNLMKFTKSKTALGIYGAVSLFLVAACSALRCLSMLFFYDKEIGYYQSGAVLPTVLNVFLILSVVAPLLCCVINSLRVQPRYIDASPSRFFAVLPAVALGAFSVIHALGLKEQLEDIYISTEKLSLYAKLSPFLLLIASLCGAAFFAMAMFNCSALVIPSVLTGIFTVFWFVMATADAYFDIYVQMNAPNKIIFMIGALSATLLVINEMRRGLPKRKPYFHLLGATLTSIFTLTSAIPSLICYFTGNMPLNYTLAVYDIVLLCVGIYSLARLISLCFGKDSPWPVIIEAEDDEQVEDEVSISEAEDDVDIADTQQTENLNPSVSEPQGEVDGDKETE